MNPENISREERILIDNYVEHISQSRQQLSFVLNYMATTERQLARLLPNSTYNLSQRLLPINNNTRNNNLYNLPLRPQPFRFRQYSSSDSGVNIAPPPSTTPLRQTNSASNLIDLITNVRRFNSYQNAFSDVIVRPTNNQILNATEDLIYSSDISLINTSCPITQEPFDNSQNIMRIRECGHCFSREGVLEWFDTNVRCPICRHDIRDISNNEVSRENITSENTSSTIESPTTTVVPISTVTITSNSENFMNDLVSSDVSVNPLMQIFNAIQNRSDISISDVSLNYGS